MDDFQTYLLDRMDRMDAKLSEVHARVCVNEAVAATGEAKKQRQWGVLMAVVTSILALAGTGFSSLFS